MEQSIEIFWSDKLEVSKLTIEALKGFVTGENKLTPYMSGPELIKFFNAFGLNDEYSPSHGGLPNGLSRNEYTFDRLSTLNGTVEFQSLVESIADHRKVDFPDDIAVRINNLIKHDGYKLVKNEDKIYKIAGGKPKDPVEIQAHFEKIKEQIIEHIRNANFMIWVAMAWFTDKDIGNELRKKHLKGVNVQVVVNDDEITTKHGLEFDLKGIEYIKVSPESPWGQKIMHNKFCIIDIKLVIHGSYNWTGSAKYNNEAITIAENRELAEKFSSEFIKLKTKKDT